MFSFNDNEQRAKNSFIEEALRNAITLRWYAAQSEETKLNIRMLYAGELGCPLCEITETLLESEDLDFIWKNFQSQIRIYSHHC